MQFWHNTPGALGMCLEHSNVNFGHQEAPSASQHDGGTTYTGTTGSGLCPVKIWWRLQCFWLSYGTKYLWTPGSCLESRQYLQRLAGIVTKSQTLCPFVHVHCLLWRSCFISCLHSNKEKSSNVAQTASILHQGVTSKHLCHCHHEILWWDYTVLVLCDIYWLTCYEHEAAMNLGWNTTRTRGGVYVYFKLSLDVITDGRCFGHYP